MLREHNLLLQRSFIMHLRIILSFFFLMSIFSNVHAQLYGVLSDSQGEPLVYANIYVKGTSIGTTTNNDGIYSLELSPGSYEVIFQYIGYEQKSKTIDLVDKLELNLVLEDESINIEEVQVLANAEDPAYAIIRKAIKKRKFYKDQTDQYACDVYIKGVQKFLDAPEKMLGQEVGTMGGVLDSNRQGIVYLSESVSKLYVDKPFKEKEIMISSRVSGNDNGFSWNSAREMNFDAYKSTYDFGRKIISPINAGAMAYYDYKLIGSTIDKHGNFINKIQLFPKRVDDPAFTGFIYIVDDFWNVESVNLFVSSKAMQLPIIDSINIRQFYIPLEKADQWMMLSQNVTFKLSGFGFKLGGGFSAVYTNYNIPA